MRRLAPLLLLLALACTGGEATAETRLHIAVRPGVVPGEMRTAVLVCGSEGVRATGFLAERAAQACAWLRDPTLRAALDAPPPGRVCTEIYGGPQEASIDGVVGEEEVDREVDRSDGCGIDDWDLLEPLLGAP